MSEVLGASSQTEAATSPERSPALTASVDRAKPSEQVHAEVARLLAELKTPELGELGLQERQEFEQRLAQGQQETQAACDELIGDLTALDRIEERFGSLEHFDAFARFLGSGELSPEELEAFMAAMEDEKTAIDTEFTFMEDGLPVNRESFVLFADKFGIPTSTKATERMSEYNEQAVQKMKDIAASLGSLPSEVSPDLNHFRQQLDALNAIDPHSDEYGKAAEALQDFLLGDDLSPSAE